MTNKSQINNTKPEQKQNSNTEADEITSSPAIAKPHVGSSFSSLENEPVENNKDTSKFDNLFSQPIRYYKFPFQPIYTHDGSHKTTIQHGLIKFV